MTLKIDHVTIAGPELDSMRASFASVGLATDYGGAHSNNLTHMALLGLRDGSYVELISTLEPGHTNHRFWPDHIAGAAGPCAWAVEVEDVAAEAARLKALGVPVDGPAYYHRQRPDGVTVEWDLAFLGEGSPGSILPFIIRDRTPRAWRVHPSASVGADEPGQVTGVAMVALGVGDLGAAVDLFRRVYGWPKPDVLDDAALGARLAYFNGSPVTLAASLGADGWLAERLARFGDGPCAYLLSTDDFDAACQRHALTSSGEWFARRVAWFDPARLGGIRLALIA